MRVLVIEDDNDLRDAVERSLRGAGFAVDQAHDLPTADEMLSVNAYDCVVFDRKLPHGGVMVDSLDYVRARPPAAPVLFLTALDSVRDRIDGLATGHDYLVKPFAMEELEVRVRRLCRVMTTGRPPVLRCGDLEVDIARHEVRRAGVLITLTAKEFTVLELLVARQGTTASRQELVQQAWDPYVKPTSNVLGVLINGLRRKLREPQMIHTELGVGYRIEPA